MLFGSSPFSAGTTLGKDWSDFWIEHDGGQRTADGYGQTYLPELLRIAEEFAPEARSFLEWGSGLSTLLLCQLAEQRRGNVVTIDHDAKYAQSVVARFRPGAPVRSLVVDLTGPMASQTDPELNYATLPAGLGLQFDFILVDGRRRIECLFTAFVLSHAPTVVALHDYRRNRYRASSVLFQIVETGDQFCTMRARPDLLALTKGERQKVLHDMQQGACG